MTKIVYSICIIVGSYLGSWIATLFGADYFSAWGIIASSIGAIAGIYVAYKFVQSNGVY